MVLIFRNSMNFNQKYILDNYSQVINFLKGEKKIIKNLIFNFLFIFQFLLIVL